jgi:hypothetical protein
MEGEREFDGTQVGPEVASVFGDGAHDEVANLAREVIEFRVGQPAQVLWRVDLFESHAPDDISLVASGMIVRRARSPTVEP